MRFLTFKKIFIERFLYTYGSRGLIMSKTIGFRRAGQMSEGNESAELVYLIAGHGAPGDLSDMLARRLER